MANMCSMGVTFEGSPGIIAILKEKFETLLKNAEYQHGIRVPFIDNPEDTLALFDMVITNQAINRTLFDVDATTVMNEEISPYHLHITYETKWSSNEIDMFRLAYGLNLKITQMWAIEESAGINDEYQYLENNFEIRSLSKIQLLACKNSFNWNTAVLANWDESVFDNEDDIDYDEDDERADREDSLLTSLPFIPFEIDTSVLKKFIYEPSTEH